MRPLRKQRNPEAFPPDLPQPRFHPLTRASLSRTMSAHGLLEFSVGRHFGKHLGQILPFSLRKQGPVQGRTCPETPSNRGAQPELKPASLDPVSWGIRKPRVKRVWGSSAEVGPGIVANNRDDAG